MHHYQAPLDDMNFLLRELFGSDSDSAVMVSPMDEQNDRAMILQQAARFVETELAPINSECDLEGCHFEQGRVTLPKAMKRAFANYAQAGWMGLALPEQWGGQDLSSRIAACTAEMLTSAHHALSMIAALNISAVGALRKFGSEELQARYLPKMVSGGWLGCMALTEAHCGSDLGLIRCSAERLNDGTYQINGNKTFISAGAHDACDNILHLVLARIKGAPAGVKGLSLFLVPQILPESGQTNHVHCIGIEQKMGIHANPTCTMSYEQAQGFLIGEVHQGIKAMFTMMNEMRMGTALQGVGLSAVSYQHSLAYATERRQGRALRGAAEPDFDADSLLVHADVRRMLLTQRAFAEGGRALGQFCAQLFDGTERAGTELTEALASSTLAEQRQLLDLLTPIAKAFCTETGLESASLAIQVFGGHGYVRESGVEQLYRDGRIATLYEGTTGIQALDLLGRKVLGTQGKSLLLLTKRMHQFCQQHQDHPQFKSQVAQLAHYTKEWPQLTQNIGLKAMKDHEEVGAAAYDYLMYSGYVCLAYLWLVMAVKADQLLDGTGNQPSAERYTAAFLQAKMRTASFYFARLLPRAEAHKAALLAGEATLAL